MRETETGGRVHDWDSNDLVTTENDHTELCVCEIAGEDKNQTWVNFRRLREVNGNHEVDVKIRKERNKKLVLDRKG